MEEGMRRVLEILFIILVAIAFLTAIYLFRDILYEKTALIKDIFSNLLS